VKELSTEEEFENLKRAKNGRGVTYGSKLEQQHEEDKLVVDTASKKKRKGI